MVLHVGSEGLNCTNLVVPPSTDVRPPLCGGVLHAYGKLNQVNVLKGFHERVKDIGLNPGANSLKRLEDTTQQTFHDENANFLHHGRRRVDTEQVFEPLNKGVNDVGFNPATGVCKELRESLCEACPHIGSGLLDGSPLFFTQKGIAERVNNVGHTPVANIGQSFTDEFQQVQTRLLPILSGNLVVPPGLNVSTDVSKEAAKELYCGTNSRAKEGEDRGCDTCPVDVGYRGLDVFPEVGSHFRPVVAVQPFSSFIKGSLDTVTYLSCKLSPVDFSQCAQDEIKLQCEPPHDDPANEGHIHLLKRTVQHGCHVCAQFVEVYLLEEVVGGLYRSVDTPAQFATHGSIVNAVNDLIYLTANQRTQSFPVGVIESLFQLISKLTYAIVNGKFLKHGTVVCTAATAATAGVILLHDDVQFINTRGSVTDFLCSLCSGTASTCQRVTIGFCVLLRSRKSGSAGQPGEQHIDDVQEGNHLINNKVDCRGKCVNDRRSHSAQTILEVGRTCSQSVHALCESTAHEIAILIEVVNTFFQRLSQRTQGETDCTIHGNTFQATKHLA